MTTFPRALRRHLAADPSADEADARRGRGQILVIFAMSIGLLFGLMAIVVDVGNWWNESLHVQLASEAAALAGVPYMPGDFTTATTKAKDEARRNGFTTSTGTTVTTAIDPASDRRLDVTISRQYNTIFLGLLGMPRVTITRQAVGEYTLPVPMGSPLDSFGDNSGGFWTVVAAQGSDRGNGDAFGSYYNPNPTLNNQYLQKGYDYAIDVPAGAGSTSIDLYDPTFCAVDPTKGTGDRWLNAPTTWPSFSTYFSLWSDPASTPLDYSDDVVVASSGTLFEHKRQVDHSNKGTPNADFWDESAGLPASYWALPDCAADPYHNRWWTLATVTTPGTYRLNVTTTDPTNINDQKGTSGSNKWGLRAVSSDPTYKAHVYGLGRIAIYANVASVTTRFYLARIEAVHAGKTMVIQLFDPGDVVTGNATLQILQPTTSGYTPATFSFTADPTVPIAYRSGTNVTSLPTTISGSSKYNNAWVTLTVSLPKTYTAPLPPGEPAGTLGGWWKISYAYTAQGTDSTTWQVSIRGNPVHLVQP